jgi:hypothetical protein
MKATDIVRSILDLIDNIDKSSNEQPKTEIISNHDDQQSRFKQIFAMLNNPETQGYDNSPNEIIAPIASVTTDAGGGMNAPKHPADIRLKDPSGY